MSNQQQRDTVAAAGQVTTDPITRDAVLRHISKARMEELWFGLLLSVPGYQPIFLAFEISCGSLANEDMFPLMESLSCEPVAAASIGQVYKGHLPSYGNVAIKVQRPGVRNTVERDDVMVRSIAEFL